MQRRRRVDLLALALHHERLLQFGQQLLLRQAVQILHHAVVVDDLELRCGEGHSQEVAVLLLARVVRIFSLALGTHAGCSCRAVVTIGHIQRRNSRKKLRQAIVRLLVANHPQVVTEAVGGREVILGFSLDDLGNDGVDLLIIGVGEEYRLDVGLLVAYMNHAILLLVGAGQLMLLDGT